MFNFIPPAVLPILLLIASNVFMTLAWYGHLKFTDKPLWVVILARWAIAFIEYCFAVPANRWGIKYYNPAELKTIQEVITFTVFVVFAFFYLGQNITWQHVLGFGLIIAGAAVVFRA